MDGLESARAAYQDRPGACGAFRSDIGWGTIGEWNDRTWSTHSGRTTNSAAVLQDRFVKSRTNASGRGKRSQASPKAALQMSLSFWWSLQMRHRTIRPAATWARDHWRTFFCITVPALSTRLTRRQDSMSTSEQPYGAFGTALGWTPPSSNACNVLARPCSEHLWPDQGRVGPSTQRRIIGIPVGPRIYLARDPRYRPDEMLVIQ